MGCRNPSTLRMTIADILPGAWRLSIGGGGTMSPKIFATPKEPDLVIADDEK